MLDPTAIVAAESVKDTVATGGVIAALVTLAGVLLRELSKSSGGAWRVVREKNREIHYLRWEKSVWQARALGEPEPSAYVAPPDQELNSL